MPTPRVPHPAPARGADLEPGLDDHVEDHRDEDHELDPGEEEYAADAALDLRVLRPALPKEPEPDSQTGYFDLVIDEAGSVERVTLISPTRQYREWMLLAAAKAWKFQPAKRDGRPVKYKLRVPIILPGWQGSQRLDVRRSPTRSTSTAATPASWSPCSGSESTSRA